MGRETKGADVRDGMVVLCPLRTERDEGIREMSSVGERME